MLPPKTSSSESGGDQKLLHQSVEKYSQDALEESRPVVAEDIILGKKKTVRMENGIE